MNSMTACRIGIAALLTYTAVAIIAPVTTRADEAGTTQTLSEPQAAAMAVRHLSLNVGKSTVVESPINIQRISIAAPEILEAVAVSPKELLINGKREGETSLILWEQGGARILFDVEVTPNTTKIEAVRRQLTTEMDGQSVELIFENNTPFLRGTVKDLTTADRAMAIVATLGKPINLLHVTTPPPQTQVLLKVRFADIDRQAESEYGINFFRNQGSAVTGSIATSQFNPTTVTAPDGSSQNSTSFNLSNALNLFLYNKSINLGALVNLLQAKSLAQVLAEPNVLAIDGKPASFLSGGEFPYPTVGTGTGGSSQISIAFRRFGVSIEFVPHITSRGTIRLEVTPEVSALDFANGLVFQGYTIPALSTRRVQTEIELESGQSFAIGGLLDNRTSEALSKVPGLSAIPLFGKLFESRTTKKNKTELLILVTPEIVRPVPADQTPPGLNFPVPFIKEGMDSIPRTPGMDQTGPVPVKPPSPTVAIETLLEEKKRDKAQPPPQQQLQLLGVPINQAPADSAPPVNNGSGIGAPASSPAPAATAPSGTGK